MLSPVWVVLLLILGIVVFLVIRRKRALKIARDRLIPYEYVPAASPLSSKPGNITSRRVLVTGGSGSLGGRIVEHLLRGGVNSVFVFDAVMPRMRDERVGYFRGDVRSQQDVERAIRESNVDTVFHVAAIIPGCGTNLDWLRSINVGGTQNVINACVACGVERLIYTSSASVMMDPDRMVDLDMEESRPYPERTVDAYAASKIVAEKLVKAAHGAKTAKGALDTCIVRPSGIYGVGDRKLVDTFIAKPNMYLGKGETVVDMVHVDSVASGEVAAFRHLPGVASGQTYNLGNGTPIQFKTLFGVGTTFYDGNPNLSWWGHAHPKSIPMPVANALALFNDTMAWLLGFPLLPQDLSMSLMRFQKRSWSANCAKAKREIGYRPLFDGDVGKTIEMMVKEYQANKSA